MYKGGIMKQSVIQSILENKIIAILRGINLNNLEELSDALYDGGIRLVEVTFNQEDPESHNRTANSISTLKKHVAGRMLIGAGTVTTPSVVEMAADAGAEYIISPNTNSSVIGRTKELGLVSIPGIFSPSEMIVANDAGADFVKVFPASVFGPSYIKALLAPLGHIRMLAVGGIDENNIEKYLSAGAVGVGVGGNLVNKAWVQAKEYNKITSLAQKLIEKSRYES